MHRHNIKSVNCNLWHGRLETEVFNQARICAHCWHGHYLHIRSRSVLSEV